ncbi:prepilin-type N-terminal cleavage/methylation domain-containing protein [Methylophaga frappieri]|nr:prepilin-type N-terminal cleavage/methylation domain-containing protein [Methylophaga frappieri]
MSSLHQSRGFTLLEMVLVLFLVGLLASAGLLFTDNIEQQAQFDETQQRLDLIKQAIAGDTSRTVNGSPELSGFVSDVGRLPLCLRELVELGAAVSLENGIFESSCDNDPSNDIRIWQLDPATGSGAGWRGPYLRANQEGSGIKSFRDGYNNIDADPVEDHLNYGWIYQVDAFSGQVDITSNGLDLSSNSDDISVTLLELNDFTVTVGNDWINVAAFINFLPLQDPPPNFRLKLNFPENGAPPQWPATVTERDLDLSLSAVFPTLDMETDEFGNIVVPVADLEFIQFSIPVNKAGNEITLQPGTVISYTDEVTPQPEDYIDEYQIAPYCAGGCTIQMTNLQTSDGTSPLPDGNHSTVTTTSGAELTASTAVVGFIASNLSKRVIYVPPGSNITGTTLTLPGDTTVDLPAGSSSEVIDSKVTLGGAEITVSETFTLENNIVMTLSGDTFAVPPGTLKNGNDLTIPASLRLPAGIHTLTVVCDSNGYVYADASCEQGNFSTATKKVFAVPRASIPLKPEPLFWGGL